MKICKFLVIIMALLLVAGLFVGCGTASNAEKLPAPAGAEDVKAPAEEFLQSMQQSVGENCEALGFTAEVFQNMTAGEPFAVYAFDLTGAVISADTYMCPLICGEQVVGQIGIAYDPSAGIYNCSLGTNYAEGLHEMLYTQVLNKNLGIVVGQMGDKLFATDGEKVLILFDQPGDLEEPVDTETIESLCGIVKENVGK